MVLLEQKPLHVRKKIAFVITVAIGVILLGTMFFVYSSQKRESQGSGGATTALGRLYATILNSTQSFFSSGDGIIAK